MVDITTAMLNGLFTGVGTTGGLYVFNEFIKPHADKVKALKLKLNKEDYIIKKQEEMIEDGKSKKD